MLPISFPLQHTTPILLIFLYHLEPLNVFNKGLRLNFIIKIQFIRLTYFVTSVLHFVSKAALCWSDPQHSKLSCLSYFLRSIDGISFLLNLIIYLPSNLQMHIFSKFIADKILSKYYCQTWWLKMTEESCKWCLISYISMNIHFLSLEGKSMT